MKNIIVLLLMLFTISISNANPITPPPSISEIYFDSTNWYIELNCLYYDFGQNSVRLISSTDTAYLSNYEINQWDPYPVLVITQDSLTTFFNINRNSDYLEIQIMYSDYWQSINSISWGGSTCNDFWNIFVSSPNIKQSLVMAKIRFEYWGSTEYDYWLVKDSVNTIGYCSYETYTFGKFCGYVLDPQHNPIQNIRVQYCSQYLLNGVNSTLTPITTDNTGYFNNENMFCKKYNITFCYNYPPYDKIVETSFIVSIEPDSVNCFEFIVDTTVTNSTAISNKHKISVNTYPNPSNGNTIILLDIPVNYQFSKALIKIYNSSGEIIRILPVNSIELNNDHSIVWDGQGYNNNNVESGIFFCNLELDGRKVAESKIVISK